MENFLFYGILVAVLLILSASFSGSETALFSLTIENRRDFAKRKDRAAQSATRLLEDPSSLLATILFSNVLVNIFYYSVQTMVAIRLTADYGGIAAAIYGVFSLILVVLVGEVLPKVLAINISRQWALTVAVPLLALRSAYKPIHFVLGRVVQAIARLLKLKNVRYDRVTAEELKMLVEFSEREGVLSRSERELIAEAVEFSEIRVSEVMKPRVEVPAYDLEDPREELLELLEESRWRKIPVYRKSRDNILGIISAKDVLIEGAADIEGLIQKVIFVPEMASVEKVLRQFREKRMHFAVVVDEYGGFVGVVTVEDILEEIVGEIEKEFAHETPVVEQTGPQEYRVPGYLSIRDWREFFQIDADFPVDTIGGLIMLVLNRVPQEGDSITVGQFVLTVERMYKRRILSVLLKTNSETSL